MRHLPSSLLRFFDKALFRNNGIARRMMVAVILFSSVVTAVITAVELTIDYQADIRGIDERIESIGKVYLPSLTESVWVAERAQIQTHLNGLLNLADIEFVGVVIGGETKWFSGAKKSVHQIERVMPLVRAYRGKDVNIGELHVVANVDNVLSRIWSKLLVMLLSNGIKTLLVTAFVLLIFQSMVGQHLEYIAGYLRRIGSNIFKAEDLGLNRPASGRWRPDALDHVANAINSMHKALSSSNADLRIAAAAFESREAMMITDPEGVILQVNRAFTEGTGYTAEEAIGKTRTLVRAERHGAAFYEAMWETIHRTGTWQGEAWNRRKNGETYPVWLTISSVRDEEGAITHYVGAHIDITEQKRAAAEIKKLNAELEQRVAERTAELSLTSEQLHRSSARVTAIVDTMADGLVTIDEQGTVESFNKAAERIFGYAAAEVIGQNVAMLMPDPYHSEHDGHLARYKATGEAKVIGIGREVMGRRKDGSVFPLDLEVNEILLGDKRRFVGTLRDITDRKQIEDSLKQASEQLAQARDTAEAENKAKSNFLATMSHEIRTPMNGVIGMLEVLQQSSLEDHQNEMVETIRDSAFSLLGLIEDILDFSKIEAGKLELESTPISLAEVLVKACAMLDPMAARRNVFLTMFADPFLPEVIGDAQRLRQIVVNLVSNAIKFSGGRARPGWVSVRAELAERGDGTATVEIRVADDGIGIDKAVQARLFQPFTQADSSTTRRFGGTGLGLAIVHNLAELMGGEVAVHSAPGEGATFVVRLSCVTVEGKDSDGVSPVVGLRCLAVGTDGGLAEDWAAYLAAAGALVERAPDIVAARACPAPAEAGPWIWLLDAENSPPAPETLRAIIEGFPGEDIRFVVFERGRHTRWRLPDDIRAVMVNANILTRQRLVTAVASAAGLVGEHSEAETKSAGKMTAKVLPSQSEASRRGQLILVAEDNETNRKVIVKQLALLGFAAVVAEDGREALQSWESGDFALLLTDLNMPRMDGYDLTAAIRAAEREGEHLPIIALTANALKSEETRCLSAGMDAYLSKPVTLARLQSVLEKWLPAPSLDETSGDVPEQLASDGLAVLDTAVLARLVGDDPAVIEDILREYRQSAQALAIDIRTALKLGDWKSAREGAHKLKSSSRSVGALALGEICARLDQTDRDFAVDAVETLAAEFEQALAVVVGIIDHR